MNIVKERCFDLNSPHKIFLIFIGLNFRVLHRAPFDKGRLVAQRRAPKVLAGDLPDPDPFDSVGDLFSHAKN
jgi:hypothetical protein